MGQVEKGNFPQIWEKEEGSGLGKGDKENLYFPLVWPGLPSDLTLEANTTRVERGEERESQHLADPWGQFQSSPPSPGCPPEKTRAKTKNTGEKW